MRQVNDFYRVEQLHLLKLKAVLNFESSTHSVVVKWPVEFGFIVGSRYVQVYPLANQIRVHTCKDFSFVEYLHTNNIRCFENVWCLYVMKISKYN